ncbi:hypothetical protein JCM11251_005267 [Rhodosporidiobolus azoricus]
MLLAALKRLVGASTDPSPVNSPLHSPHQSTSLSSTTTAAGEAITVRDLAPLPIDAPYPSAPSPFTFQSRPTQQPQEDMAKRGLAAGSSAQVSASKLTSKGQKGQNTVPVLEIDGSDSDEEEEVDQLASSDGQGEHGAAYDEQDEDEDADVKMVDPSSASRSPSARSKKAAIGKAKGKGKDTEHRKKKKAKERKTKTRLHFTISISPPPAPITNGASTSTPNGKKRPHSHRSSSPATGTGPSIGRTYKKRRVRLDGDASSDEDFDPDAASGSGYGSFAGEEEEQEEREEEENDDDDDEQQRGRGRMTHDKGKGKGKAVPFIDLTSSPERSPSLHPPPAASIPAAKATKRVTRASIAGPSREAGKESEDETPRRRTRASQANGSGEKGSDAASEKQSRRRSMRIPALAAASSSNATPLSGKDGGYQEDAAPGSSRSSRLRKSVVRSRGVEDDRMDVDDVGEEEQEEEDAAEKSVSRRKSKSKARQQRSSSIVSITSSHRSNSSSASTAPSSSSSSSSSSHSSSALSSSDELSDSAREKKYKALDMPDRVLGVLRRDNKVEVEARREGRRVGKVEKGGKGQGSKGYKRLKLETNAAAAETVRVGDIVEVKTSIGGKGGWYLAVEDLRVLTSDLDDPSPALAAAFPDKGKSKKTTMARTVYIKGSWLYSRDDFRGMGGAGSQKTWVDPSYPMGPNERVKTDHVDWRAQTMLRSKGPETLYIFDDSYPAAPPGSSNSSAHPLSTPYRTSSLLPLQPSPYVAPALETPSLPLNVGSERETGVPVFFFGVGAKRGTEGRGREVLDTGSERKGRDGRRGTAYVRAAFSFETQPEIKRHGEGDEEEEEEEEEGSGKRGKGKRSPKGKKVWPLEFQRHSLSLKPYNPRRVQHFSPATETWYDVRDLEEGGYYGRMGTPPPAVGSASPSKRTEEQRTNEDSSLTARLGELASSPIVRGGAYGLIGNSYLVTRASYLSTRLGTSSTAAAVDFVNALDIEALEAEGDVLLSSAKEWERGVHERVEGRGDGKGLGKEWRSKGEPPREAWERDGEVRWLCPETGVPI